MTGIPQYCFLCYAPRDSNNSLLIKQLVSFCIGFAVMLIMAQIPLKLYQSFSPWFYAVGSVSLLAVMIFDEVHMGAQCWLKILGLDSVQPLDFMKLAMHLIISRFLSVRSLPLTFKAVMVTLALICLSVSVIADQLDLFLFTYLLTHGW